MYKLLVVEDEHLIRRYLTNYTLYKDLDLTIIGVAENGEKGAELIKKYEPDIVLSDINMPLMSAFEMFAATKEFNYKKIILSGYNDFKNAQKAIHYSVCEFLVKPIDPTELRQCLKSAIEDLNKVTSFQSYTKELEKINLFKNVRTSHDPVVTQITEFITCHYQDKFTIADLSSQLGYSESYVYKKVKSHLGITLNDYLNRYRLKMAMAQLVEEPRLLVYELASQNGFGDYKYFNYVFKKYTNMTVSEFKEKVLS